jgi:hypothetical protein
VNFTADKTRSGEWNGKEGRNREKQNKIKGQMQKPHTKVKVIPVQESLTMRSYAAQHSDN